MFHLQNEADEVNAACVTTQLEVAFMKRVEEITEDAH